jgi:uncharacterized protein involved in outer membrane biogenesis
MQTEVSQVDLKRVLRGSGFADKSVGHIGGRATLKGIGDSIADLMATLDGQLFLVMKGGRLDSLLIELGGLDATQAIGDLLGDEEARPIRCAFTELKAQDGQVDVMSFVIDTVDTQFTGDGSIDLDRERIHFTLVPHAKDFSIFAAPTPFHIRGRFSDPSFYPDSDLAERVAASVVLGLVATPLAAIIPLVEPGTGENAACRGLLASAKEVARPQSREPNVPPEEPPAPFITEPRP